MRLARLGVFALFRCPRVVVGACGATALAIVACSSPTEMCACPPARTAVIVLGSVASAAGVPLAGARLYFDAVPPTLSADPPMTFESPAVADAAGAFSARVYSVSQPMELAVRVAVIRAGMADTVRLRTGAVAMFRPEHDRLDTLRLALEVP